jgi:hemerythrin-like domain-containing protein
LIWVKDPDTVGPHDRFRQTHSREQAVQFEKRVNQLLHDEHMAVLSLMNRFQGALAEGGADAMMDPSDPAVARLLNELVTAIEKEIDGHFRFEEIHLFPELEAAGEADFVTALQEDHDALRPLAEKVSRLAQRALNSGLSSDDWRQFRQLGAVYAQDLMAHAEREEAAMLPMLEECLDEATDTALWQDQADGSS